MAPSEMRYALLAGLAWRLWTVSLGCWLVFPERAEPVLFVRCRDRRRDPVLAVERGQTWLLLWRGLELNASGLDEAARRIAAGGAP
ncbi:hypothetical protein GCM10023085_21260 [Actinomadura viridis]|uniref:Uncharacterized protein n=1 Tax=Actinomadura viridis TaxID=58110 RepID=A0A931GIW2_9ACTN|nr:hypothetical protein [Actinomadura viridis]MBG6088502.1 hypothetical protein [Actinomadura viridis]